jgi:hypothetical protein
MLEIFIIKLKEPTLLISSFFQISFWTLLLWVCVFVFVFFVFFFFLGGGGLVVSYLLKNCIVGAPTLRETFYSDVEVLVLESQHTSLDKR